MAGLTDILNTARDALSAQSYGLGVTGQNVANVNTPGYVRRRALLSSLPLGDADFGTVVVDGVQRLADHYTEQRHYSAVGLSASADESNRMLGYVEAQFDVATGQDIGSAMDELFASFSTLSTDPQNTSARKAVLSRATTLAARFNNASNAIANFRQDLVEQATSTTNDINGLADSIAKVTSQIMNAQAGSHDASDLQDKRDDLLLQLSELVDVRTFTNGAGQLVVQGAGTTLVEGDNSRHLGIALNDDGTMRIDSITPNGGKSDVTRFVSGGKLDALQHLHDVDSVAVQNNLDQLAYDVGSAINAQHAAGYGLDGSTGNDLFDISNGVAGLARVIAVNPTLQADQVAASASPGGLPGNGDNAIAISQIALNDIANGNTHTASEAYGAIVADVGSRKANAEHEVDVRDSMKAQIFAMRESESGVNLDEEMVSLTKFQRAYEASSKVLTTADQLLADLIDKVGR